MLQVRLKKLLNFHKSSFFGVFRSLINQLVKRASSEGDLTTEYAIVCHEIKEIFEPAAGTKDGKNPFLQITANQCQITLKSLRLVLIVLVVWMLPSIAVF
jgi:hypothetical protein